MFGWFTPSSRTDALERELAALRATLADAERRLGDDAAARADAVASGIGDIAGRADAGAAAARTLRGDLTALSGRIARVEERQRSAGVAIAAAIDRLDRLEQLPEADPRAEEIEMSLLRLDHQLAAHVDETRTLARSLLERIEPMRNRRAE